MADLDDLGARIGKNLKKTEVIRLIEFMQRAIAVRTESDFIALEPALKRLIDYKFLMCGFGERTQFSKKKRGPYINVSYPEEFIDHYIGRGLIFQDHFVITALNSLGLHHSSDLTDTESWHRTEAYSVSHSLGINEGYRSVIKNGYAGMASVFFYTAPRLPRDERVELILEILTPHLHEALRRIFDCPRQSCDNPLSNRELEILRWIKEGKSSWSISLILSISEATVKFHIKNILRKLDASTRAQAVACAMERGYIDHQLLD